MGDNDANYVVIPCNFASFIFCILKKFTVYFTEEVCKNKHCVCTVQLNLVAGLFFSLEACGGG